MRNPTPTSSLSAQNAVTLARPVAAMVEAKAPLPGLHLVATPIGAARDITLRALDVLNGADMLAAEDTRVLRHLLEIHGIPLRGRRVISYHDHNADRQRPAILAALEQGLSVAYTADAGTPMVADPGYRLARDTAAAGWRVHAAPGASAMLVALSLAGLPSDRFMFVGFPPSSKGARCRWIEGWAKIDATIIAYESPRRVKSFLADLCDSDPNRSVVICRELTKKFEEVIRGTATDLAQSLPDEGLRGEVVVVLDKPSVSEASPEDIRAALAVLLRDATVKDAAKIAAIRFDLPRRDVYAMALEIAKEEG